MGALAGLNRRLVDQLRTVRIVLDGDVPKNGTPKQPPLFINPTEPPSASTAAIEGALYFDDDLHALMQHNGSAWEEVGASLGGSAATIAGTLDVTGAATFSSTVAATGAISGPRKVYNAATVLTNADSGAFCLFSTAAGYTYTLPTPVAGTWFDFYVGITITSSNAKILTPASVFLLGNFIQSTDGTYTSASHAADGTTIRSWVGNGTTTGGLIGDWVRVVAISTTQYSVWGMGRATGSEATPFATS